VLIVFAFALAWVFACLGLVMRAPNAVMNVGFGVLFPVTFLSNVFVDPDTLPAGLKTIVDLNPISHLVTATRGLMDGTATTGEVATVLIAAAVLTAVFAPLTSRLYRNRS
jgi:ABC-2 type transport system permease protein